MYPINIFTEEESMPVPQKPGYQTTEFWTSLGAASAVLYSGSPDSGMIVGGIAGIYAAIRGWVKRG